MSTDTEKTFVIKNPSAPASPGQRKMLWAKTGKGWYGKELVNDINMGQASGLIDNILKYFKGEGEGGVIEGKIHYHTGDYDWKIAKLVNTPLRTGKKFSKKLQKNGGDNLRHESDIRLEPVTFSDINPEDMTVADLLKAMKAAQDAGKIQKTLDETLDNYAKLEKEFQENDRKLRDEILDLNAVVEELQNKPGEYPTIEIPEIEYIKPEIFDKAVMILNVCGQLHVSGPAGCGKTYMAAMIAKATEREFYLHSCSGGPSLENIIGSTELVKENGTQVTKFIKALPLEHLEKENTLTCFDEFPALEPESSMGLNGLMEPKTRAISTKAGEVKRHTDNWIITTGNTNGSQLDRKYVGAQIQDGSNTDRRPSLKMEYDINVERKILEGFQLSESQTATIMKRMALMRESCSAMQVPFDPSTRRMVNLARLVKCGMPMDDAFEVCFLNDVDERAQRQIKNW